MAALNALRVANSGESGGRAARRETSAKRKERSQAHPEQQRKTGSAHM